MSSQDVTTVPFVLDIQYHTIQGAFVQTVDARRLYERLGHDRGHFARWLPPRIEEYGFVRDIDYLVFARTGENLIGGRPSNDYFLTLDMAKELCMVEKSELGRRIRRYFIDCEKALTQGMGMIAQQVQELADRVLQLEAKLARPTVPDQLTPKGELPPPAPRVRERAEVSWHMAAVWSLLVRTGECLTHHEIAQRTGVALPTARAHTRYLVQLGLLERHETHPRHLYEVSAQAANRNVGVYQRLQRLTEIMQARQAF